MFQNLRASRQTELANEYPSHVVTAWLGNTEKVASKHYLQVTDAHFDPARRAKTSAISAANVSKVAPRHPAANRATSQKTDTRRESRRKCRSSRWLVIWTEYPLGESNPCLRTENPMSWATRRRGQSFQHATRMGSAGNHGVLPSGLLMPVTPSTPPNLKLCVASIVVQTRAPARSSRDGRTTIHKIKLGWVPGPDPTSSYGWRRLLEFRL